MSAPIRAFVALLNGEAGVSGVAGAKVSVGIVGAGAALATPAGAESIRPPTCACGKTPLDANTPEVAVQAPAAVATATAAPTATTPTQRMILPNVDVCEFPIVQSARRICPTDRREASGDLLVRLPTFPIPVCLRRRSCQAGSMAGALEGIVVADFSRVLAGPYATMLLADHGADVIKVESPDGDTTRGWGPPFSSDGQTTYFGSVNRNKRSIVLDLNVAADQELARRLSIRADVVIENLMPGKLGDFGLGYEAVRTANPGVVYCSISGFGSEDGAQLPGFDLLVQAMGGLMSITGMSEPTRAGVAVVDVLTGLHASVGILAALRERDRTGQGQRVEVTLLGSLLSSMVNQSAGFVAGSVVPGLTGNAHPSIAPYQLYEASDRSMVVAAGTDRQFVRLVGALGLAELAEDPLFATNSERVGNLHQLNAVLSPVLAQQPAAVWVQQLTAVGVPCGPVNNIGEAFALAEQLGLQPRAPFESSEDEAGRPTVANPVAMSTTPVRYRTPPPGLDRDGEAIREWLTGLDPDADPVLRS